MKACLRVVLLQSLLVLSPLAQAQSSQALIGGWNLVGNNSSATIDPLALFGNATIPITGISDQITSVWKWDAINTKWMFFAPSYDTSALATYALGKSYGVMTSIASGEGYWVNAKAALTLTLPAGTQGQTSPLQSLVQGWNLVANNSAAALDPITLFGDKPMPVAGISDKITSVWKWDAANTKWMFFAPSYEPEALATYAAGKSYGVLTTILPGEGYWVNAGSALSLSLPPTLSGVAATGAPLGGADVTLLCGDGATKTTTADASGAYSFGLSNCAGPYALKAVGRVGDTEISLVSLQPNPTDSGASLTVNATPITDALASTVTSTGNPQDLIDNFANEKANITETKVSNSEQAFRAALGGALASAGASTGDNLISTPFKADGSTAMDKVLDMVQVAVQPNGEIHMYTAKGAMVDDQGNFTTPPAPGSVLVLNKGALPQSSDAALLPGSGSSEVLTIAMLEDVKKALQACFNLPSAQRGTYKALLGDCAALPLKPYVAEDNQYRHQGRDGSQEFDGMLADASLESAIFFKPTIVRQLSATRALVKFPYMKVNGFPGGLTTVVENVNNVWTLVGNQRIFEVFVNGFVNQRMSLSAPQTNRYETGIQLTIRNNPAFPGDASIVSAKIHGPGLPGYVDSSNFGDGIALSKLDGCDWLTISVTNVCANLFKLRATRMSDGTVVTPTTGTELWAMPALLDDEILAIKPLSLYKVVITTTTGTVTYWERLRARAQTAAELARVKFLSLSDESKALLTSYTGGAAPAITWTKPGDAAPAHMVSFFHNNFSDSKVLKLEALSATIPCTTNPDCVSGGNYKTFTLAAGSTNSFRFGGRNRYDVSIMTQYFK